MSIKEPEAPIRLLHLSDVHFAVSKSWDSNPLLYGLASYIGDEIKAGLVPDLVAFTGDLAFSGKVEEYNLALDWLETRLWPVMPKDLPRDRLLLVPGNHDVDRDAIGFSAKAIQSALLEQSSQNEIAKLLMDEGEREPLLKRQAVYFEFVKEWYGKPQTLPWWQRPLDIRQTRLHLAGLNSAFMAHGNQDRSKLLISRYQIHQTVLAPEGKEADWHLALLHHPWDYLTEWDGHEVRPAVHLYCDLVLRGHLHFALTERILPPDPKRACLELAAGCLYEDSQYPNAFQWIELYTKPRRVRVLYREWRHGVWDIDRTQPGCPDGIAEYLLDTSTSSSNHPKQQEPSTPIGLPSVAAPDLPELLHYQEAAIRTHEKLPITGFATKARVAIQLDELYVPLRAMLDTRLNGGCDFADSKDAEDRLHLLGVPEIPLIEAFRAANERNRDGLVILGDPGAGKTTQLKRLLLSCFRQGAESLGLPDGTIPVFLPLRDLEDLSLGVDAFITKSLDSPHLNMGADFGLKLLNRGRLLLLFDGLDEVSDPAQRARVSRWIEDLAQRRPTCYPVVTCRFAGYGDEVRLGGEFLELHLRPLTPEQSEEFIRNWYKVVTASQSSNPAAFSEAAAEADKLIQRLREPGFRSARMAEMTRNPLLLANLCLVHYDRKGILPKGRHELYDECIQVLLELWRRDKKLAVSIPARTGRELLGPVALWLHGKDGRTRASLGELAPVLEPAIKKAQWAGDAASLLRAIRDESGLLTGWGAVQFGFMHLGFQEYLAAMDIRRQVLEDWAASRPVSVLSELAGHYHDSWWQEVILLLLAQGDPPLFEPFMNEVLVRWIIEEGDQLMAFIREEAVGFSAQPWLAIVQDANRPLAVQDASLKILERLLKPEEFAQLVADLPPQLQSLASGKTRLIGEIVPEDALTSPYGGVELLLVPHGKFLMGSPKGVGSKSEWPQHEVAIKRFYLGRHPVTNEEYRRFLEANPNVKEPNYWADRRFNQDRQPVVGVNWKDAKLFCEWAGGRLPTEAEWEYACRAGTTTQYHWGNDGGMAAEFAWFGEGLHNGSTHPVGEKRPNPWGFHDLTGNVWEWIEDVWHDDYEGAQADGSAWTHSGEKPRRVIRGGSWNIIPDALRSANRYWTITDYRYFNIGFRLAQDL